LPLFWIAMVEAVANLKIRQSVSAFSLPGLPCLLIFACVIAQAWLGPAASIGATTADWLAGRPDRARKNAFISQIPSQASVVAPFPYLTHLAMREKLYSLHYILKGLKTLSRQSYEPPLPTDFVLIDYLDSSTFDSSAGYYHPAMKTADGRTIPSSDRLLHDFLKGSNWIADLRNELTLLRRNQGVVGTGTASPNPERLSESVFEIGTHTQLVSIAKSGSVISNVQPLEIRLSWRFQSERDLLPWMILRLAHAGKGYSTTLTKGLCAPEVNNGDHEEIWRVDNVHALPAGDYSVEALFIDNSKRAWYESTGGSEPESTLLSEPVPLGWIKLQP
jgi:hypothetical protein